MTVFASTWTSKPGQAAAQGQDDGTSTALSLMSCMRSCWCEIWGYGCGLG
jgi:hypothetical protein